MIISWQQSVGLDSNHLVEFKTLLNSEDVSHLVNKKVKNDLLNLFEQAKRDKQDIVIVSGYRSFHKQLNIWNDKWKGYRPVYSKQGRPLNVDKMSSIEKYKAIALWSALPGLSRHHWGTDFDIFSKQAIEQGYKIQLTPEEFSKNGVCAGLNDWLKTNLEKFGFFRPYNKFKGGVAEEPWHISHIQESQKILEQFDFNKLRLQLKQSDLCESEFISERLQDYKERYFKNIC
ncbi:MAG: M15 family metallopeptidase [Kangiellaceae bacterium]